MLTTLRPFATASVALVSASAIAITPVALEPTLPDINVANPAVRLSAAVDPITPWLEVLNTSGTNLASLANAWLEAPAPVVQQVIANLIGYLSQLPDLPAIVEQIVANLGAAVTTPFAVDPSTLENTNPLLNHRSLWTVLQALGDASPIPPGLQPLLDFSSTYTSGVLLGLVGPVIGPVLALAASVNAVVENLSGETPDLEAAIGTLISTPAAMADAFLNGGQTLDLTPVLDALGLDLDPAPGTDVTNVGITFGGLLSPGGSIFNALNFDILIAGSLDVPIAGQGPGAIGSLIGLSQAIAKALGWSGVGNTLAPPANTPAAELRQADDASLLAARTVTLQTSPRALSEQGATLDQTATATGEAPAKSGTTPAVSTTDEEPIKEASESSSVTTPIASADEEASDAQKSISDGAEKESDTDTNIGSGSKPNDPGSRDVNNGAEKSSETKTGQNDGSDSDSSASSSNSSDSQSNS